MQRANLFTYDECIEKKIPFPDLPVLMNEHHGQYAEDIIVMSLLVAWSNRTNAKLWECKYLEIGGNHPIATSTTYLINKIHTMRGVIVEANPALIEDIRTFRPHDVVLHGAVQVGDAPTVKLSVSNSSEISSLDRSFVLGWDGGRTGERDFIDVPALRINQIIKDFLEDTAPVFLSIDIEGLDFPVVQDLNLQKYRPVIIQIEPSDIHIPGNSGAIAAYLQAKDYILTARTVGNQIFVAAEHLTLSGSV